jgi:hypothetical protein
LARCLLTQDVILIEEGERQDPRDMEEVRLICL